MKTLNISARFQTIKKDNNQTWARGLRGVMSLPVGRSNCDGLQSVFYREKCKDVKSSKPQQMIPQATPTPSSAPPLPVPALTLLVCAALCLTTCEYLRLTTHERIVTNAH